MCATTYKIPFTSYFFLTSPNTILTLTIFFLKTQNMQQCFWSRIFLFCTFQWMNQRQEAATWEIVFNVHNGVIPQEIFNERNGLTHLKNTRFRNTYCIKRDNVCYFYLKLIHIFCADCWYWKLCKQILFFKIYVKWKCFFEFL